MKNTLIRLSLLTILAFTGASLVSEAGNIEKTNGKFIKNSWSEIDADQDSILFQPFGGWDGVWSSGGYLDFEIDKYLASFKNHQTNFWNIIHKKIITGGLQIYYPYDPEWFNTSDEGFLNYPVLRLDSSATIINDVKVREDLFYGAVLGTIDQEESYPLISVWGEDSVDFDGNYVYYPPESYWYEDKDIIKYKLKEDVIINSKGDVKKRIIRAIAPVVYSLDYNGNIVGEKTLFWLNFDDLSSLLNSHYFLDPKTSRVTSYLDYFEKRMFVSKVVKEDNLSVQPEK